MTADIKPIIITAPGSYRTRGDQRAVVNEHNPESQYTFNCKGYIERGGRRNVQDWSTWKPNGMNRAAEEHRDDIVGPWSQTA